MKYSRLIDKYLDGLLHGEELRKFEEELLSNPKLEETVEEVRALNDFMQEQHDKLKKRRKLKEDIDYSFEGVSSEEIEKDIKQFSTLRSITKDEKDFVKLVGKTRKSRESGKIRRITFRHKWWFIAATVIILFGIFGVIYNSHRTIKTSESLYAEYFEPYISPVGTVRSTVSYDSLFYFAISLYNEREYESAINIFKLIPEDYNLSHFVKLLAGSAYMELDRIDEAIKELSFIDNQSLCYESAQWYLALCYLKAGDRDNAIYSFKYLVSRNSFRSEIAEKILKKIN